MGRTSGNPFSTKDCNRRLLVLVLVSVCVSVCLCVSVCGVCVYVCVGVGVGGRLCFFGKVWGMV